MNNIEHSKAAKEYRSSKKEFQALIEEKKFIKTRISYLIKSGESYDSVKELLNYNKILSDTLNSLSKTLVDLKRDIKASQRSYKDNFFKFKYLDMNMFNAAVRAYSKSIASSSVNINPLFVNP